MKLTYQSVITLRAELLALDGLEQAVEIRGQHQLIKKPFKFSGKTRLKIARNLRAMEAAFHDYDAARMGLVRELAGGEDQVPEALLPRFHGLHYDLLNEKVSVESTPLEEAELNLDENEIPSRIVAVILEFLILDEF